MFFFVIKYLGSLHSGYQAVLLESKFSRTVINKNGLFTKTTAIFIRLECSNLNFAVVSFKNFYKFFIRIYGKHQEVQNCSLVICGRCVHHGHVQSCSHSYLW